MRLCRRCLVRGRVQGVWFRASTREQARQLGVEGYAENLRDGSVEVLACGTAAAVDALTSWLRRGPPMAEVGGVSCEDVADEVARRGFAIR